MYSVYKIYQADKLVHVTYHDIIPEFTDKTKLNIILNNPTIPHLLFEDYYRSPELFSISTHKTGIPNSLDASYIVIEEAQLIGTDKLELKPKAAKKSGTKKAQQSKTEG